MYRRHYHLRLTPFKVEPDPEFLWLGEKHAEGLATLQYGILENKGFILLTGDVGTGKTVLIHRLRKNLSSSVRAAVLQDPRIEVLDLYRILAADLQIAGRFEGKADFLIRFKRFLTETYGSQQQVLIIIDEAHRLSCELLDEIRVLSNIDYESRQTINIFFVGQGEFNRMLMDPRNQAVRQRIAVSYHLAPLDEQETPAYVRHRLKVAGSGKELFTPEALRAIHRFAGGTPRLINVICDRALVTGYVKELKQIGAETIRECAAELDLAPSTPAPGSGFKTSDRDRSPGSKKLKAQSSKQKAPSARPAASSSGHAAVAVAKQVKREGPQKPLKKGSRWLVPALVGALGVLAYTFFTMWPSENIRHEESTTAVRPADPKQPEPADLRQAPRAMPAQGKKDQPAGVSLKQDPPAKVPVAETRLEPAEEESAQALPQSAVAGRAPEAVAVSPAAAPRLQRFYVLFKPGSADLENSSFDVLMEVSQLLAAYPHARITLAAFGDPTAGSGHTRKLLALRANCVKSFLASRGVEARLTVAAGSARSLPGPSRPPAAGDLESWSEIRIETGREG
jgi:general secretion pathway protein A